MFRNLCLLLYEFDVNILLVMFKNGCCSNFFLVNMMCIRFGCLVIKSFLDLLFVCIVVRGFCKLCVIFLIYK